MKLSSRSVPLCITVMVPNSLGPAELLNHYGTDEQKKHYLPLLARGEEIPCFALTEPTAGSDAGSIQANGVVFRGADGKLYLKLNWNKRWITLAAVSTVLGLAFRLRDPDNLLGKGVDPGITCALIPSKTAGVDLTRRHDPLHVPFYNCPTRGKDVVVPIDAIVGGPERAGHGWLMLMECLAAGRGISLPAQTTGAAKVVTRVASAHAAVRKQFGMSIGKFEGIAEPMARIGGFTYLMEAARRYTCGALDQGAKPAVVTAMAKYQFTELQRRIINDGMDIQGGQAITRGPRNLLANIYFAAPIAITVEGANILTRTLIIFGQGALRAHPYAFKEVDALETGDVRGFDRAFWAHIGHIVRNLFRAVLLSLSRGHLSFPGTSGGVVGKYAKKLSWASATFALMADIAMGTLGGKLKFKEKITGRFADALSWMYLGTAVLRRFEADGNLKEDEPFVDWCLTFALLQIQGAFDGIFANMEAPGLAWFFSGPIQIWSKFNALASAPSDPLENRLSALLQKPQGHRERLTQGIFVPKSSSEALGRLENAFELTQKSEDIQKRIRKGLPKKSLKKPTPDLLKEALDAKIITPAELETIKRAEEARDDAIQVDEFGLKEYLDAN